MPMEGSGQPLRAAGEVVDLLIEIRPSHRFSAVCGLVLLAVVGESVNWNRYLSKDTPEMIR
jgi:hypothetical protein